MTDSLNIVLANTTGILDTLNAKANEYSLTLSKGITSPWEEGINAISQYQEQFNTSASSTMETLGLIEKAWQSVIDAQTQAAMTNMQTSADSNNRYTQQTVGDPNRAADTEPALKPQTQQQLPAKGASVKVKSSATHFSAQSGNAKMASFVPGGTYTVMQVGVNGDTSQILIGKNGQYTGWVKLSDLEGYAKGTKGVKKDQLAMVDEMGLEELVMHAGPDGRLQYLSKGSSVLNHELTDRIMNMAMNPQEFLDKNRPAITPSKSVVNNNVEFKIDASMDSLVKIEHVDGNNIDEITRVIDKAWDKKLQGLNSAIRKFVR